MAIDKITEVEHDGRAYRIYWDGNDIAATRIYVAPRTDKHGVITLQHWRSVKNAPVAARIKARQIAGRFIV